MKRVRIANGTFVAVSNDLLEKAGRALKTGISADLLRSFRDAEGLRGAGAMLGSGKPSLVTKPLVRPARRGMGAAAKIAAAKASRSKLGWSK